MAKVYFKVLTKTEKPQKEVSIRVRFKDGNVDQATATGETVKLEHWNLEQQDFKKTAFKGKDEMISRLNKLQSHILEEALKYETYPTGWLLDIVERYRFPEKYRKQNAPTMFEWAESYIGNLKLSKRTVYKYNAMLESLKEYNPKMDWSDLNLKFYREYINYLESKGQAKNTIFDRMKVIKALAKAAELEKVNQFTDYKNFKLEPEESDNIYLNESEITRIANVNLARHKHLEKTRDLFVVACWVGCRYGDLQKVTPENIKNNLIYFKQAKTKGKVVIPLHPQVKAILYKYNGTLPTPLENQPFNRALKLIAKASRLRQKEIKGITKGGEYNEELLEKWEMVSAHTARRSFATNLYNQGLEVVTIMKMTGHKSIKTFLNYIKVSEEEHAKKLEKHWERFYS